MIFCLWYFWIYSFLGFLLERMFAALTRAEHRARRCFLLLPLCPVYGLGMLAVLALPSALPFWALALWGGVMAVSGFRQGNKLKLLYAAGAFALLTVCGTVLMEFITRPL